MPKEILKRTFSQYNASENNDQKLESNLIFQQFLLIQAFVTKYNCYESWKIGIYYCIIYGVKLETREVHLKHEICSHVTETMTSHTISTTSAVE